MKAIFKREFKAYFKSPIGFVFLAAFFAYASLMFVFINLNGQMTLMKYFFENISLIFIFVIPVLTMRTFAEERKSKTDQLLLTAPVKVTDIVLGKFLAAASVLLVAVVATMFYVVVLKCYGEPVFSEIFIGYLGLFLMGTFFISIGLFLSSLTQSQVIAAVSTLGIIFFLWFSSSINLQFSAMLTGALSWRGIALDWLVDFLAINNRFADFTLGVLNFVPVFYFVSLTALFLLLTVRVIEKRRWK
jgi:ABC-2 type transport system permease protein